MVSIIDLCVILAMTACLLVIRLRQTRTRLPLPPGPKGLPLLGNLLRMPKENPWDVYNTWAEELGSDILYFYGMGKKIILINSYESAVELFEKRGAIYSSRPRSVMLDIIGYKVFTMFSYGGPWRTARRMFQRTVNPSTIPKFHEYQIRAVNSLLVALTETQDDGDGWMHLVHHAAATIAIKISYGIDIQSLNDPLVALIEKEGKAFTTAVQPGRYLVDTIPLLRYIPSWVPGAKFQREAKIFRKHVTDAKEVPFATAKRNFMSDNFDTCLVSHNLQLLDKERDVAAQEEVIASVATTLYGAGTETTTSSLWTVIAAMILHPEAQRRAQTEIDTVLQGNYRLLSFEDREKLPYVSAIVKEAMRWQPVVPMGLVHSLDEDDEYRGYFLPKGSTVMVNAWQMLHDESVYTSPSTFDPGRFLTQDGKLNPDVRDPACIAFGFGRRICPGMQLADETTWLAVACILQVFNIMPEKKDESIKFYTRITRAPYPFKCVFKLRSEGAAGLVSSLRE